jgi:hypothetical protein
MSAKDCVPEGGSFQARAGEIFLPVQAYLAGMDCPFTNASLVSARDMAASVEGVSDGAEAGDVAMASGDAGAVPAGVHAANRKTTRQQISMYLMTNLLF